MSTAAELSLTVAKIYEEMNRILILLPIMLASADVVGGKAYKDLVTRPHEILRKYHPGPFKSDIEKLIPSEVKVMQEKVEKAKAGQIDDKLIPPEIRAYKEQAEKTLQEAHTAQKKAEAKKDSWLEDLKGWADKATDAVKAGAEEVQKKVEEVKTSNDKPNKV